MTFVRPNASAGGESAAAVDFQGPDQGEAAGAPGGGPVISEIESAQPHTGSGVCRDVVWGLIIFIVALVLRGVYLYQVRSCPFFGHEIMDPQYHRQWGEAIAASETFTDGPYFRAPLYPWVLGAVYRVFGTSDLAPRIVQIVFGSVSCVVIYLIGRRAFSRRVGILAGLSSATYWLFLYFEAELLIAWLAMFLDLLLVWILLLTGDRRNPWLWLLTGILLGLSALARPTILLFAPAVLIWLAVLHGSNRRRVLGYGACFVLGITLLIAPVTVRNRVVGHDLVLISSAAGVNFFIGNNPGSDGMTAIVPGTPAKWWPGYYAQIERAENAMGRTLKPSEVSQYYWYEAFKFMQKQPREAAALLLRKLGVFWSKWEVSNNQDIRFVTDNFAPVTRFLPLTFWAVGSFGLLGLLISLGQAQRLFPLWGFVLVYTVGVVAFFVTARYRLPVVPVLMVLGSQAVFWCLDAIRFTRRRFVVVAVVVLVPAAILVSRVPKGVEAGVAQSHSAAGIVLASQGRNAEAEEYLLESVRLFPALPGSWFTLAMIKLQQQDLAQMEHYLRQTLKFDPAYPEARKHLGFALARQENLDGAIEQFGIALASSPDDSRLYANFGGVLIQQGRIAEGLEMLRKGVRLDPGVARKFESLARTLIQARRFADALRVLEAGVAGSAKDASQLTLLARLLATCPDPDLRNGPRSLRYAQRACELTGRADPTALDAVAVAHFAVGQLDKAIETGQRAVELATQQGDLQLADRMRKRLQHYESKLASPDSDHDTRGNAP
ncbi:MAG: tetratricopeptide repeat protein [bacterium]|nr:tetratricopeptide repeat protein [bacterium]